MGDAGLDFLCDVAAAGRRLHQLDGKIAAAVTSTRATDSAPAVLGAAGAAPQSLRATGTATVSTAPQPAGEVPGSPEIPLSPADQYRGMVRRRGLTVEDVVASALAATTRAELSACKRAFFAIAEPGWATADIGPLVRTSWPRRHLDLPDATVTAPRLFGALARALSRTP